LKRLLALAAAGALLTLAGYLTIANGLLPANADTAPTAVEKWVAKTSLRGTLKREAPAGKNPLPPTAENYAAAVKLYAANCAVCHGAADAARSNVAKGLYQEPPQLAKDGVEDDPDGVSFWKVKHGIRFTGMPGFGRTLSDTQIWQLTLFLKNMDHLPQQAESAWKAVPSQGNL
jgi:mono/diheme cytochrome c family protein